MQFYIVDVFTDKIFGGNPAGVVVLPEGADFPDDELMRKTAAELRYSETAFVKRLGAARFQCRYFTPAAEVELCGHATIGAFYALLQMGMIEPGKSYINETISGALEIAVNDASILMDMAKPQFFEKIEEEEALSELYRIMGLAPAGQGKTTQFPQKYLLPRKVSTGLADIMLPVRDEAELEKISPDFAALTELSRRYGVTGVHAFTCNAKDGLVHARNFAPLYAIDEEAATGTSNGALTYYLYDYGLVKENVINTVVQGEKMGRPSKISTQLLCGNGVVKVKVGGFAVTLASGEINI